MEFVVEVTSEFLESTQPSAHVLIPASPQPRREETLFCKRLLPWVENMNGLDDAS